MNDAESFMLKELEKRNGNSNIVATTIQDYLSDLEAISRGEYIKPISTGLKSLDRAFNYFLGMLFIVSGYPQAGKGEFLRFLANNWVRFNNGKVCFFIPEDDIPLSIWDMKKTYGFSNDYIWKHFAFLEIKDNYGMPTAEDILKESTGLTKKGFNYFVIDPMNWLTDNNALSIGYEKLRITLTDFKQFCKQTKSILAYVEHPNTPRPDRDGVYPKCTKYSVTGGLTHFKKVDGFIILHREKQLSEIGTEVMSVKDRVYVEIAKLKMQKFLGTPDTIEVGFDRGIYRDLI